uniref:Oligopeptide transporter OPT-like protein n=1 Tax=Ganoderma boninense TaxID=34458 RepID=A0A5K1K731_9APHY|nr:Oligopeptide transporter OPT-like protein [Ganoderma boninense]
MADNGNDGWSLSLRSNNYHYDNSSSDDDSDDDLRGPPPSDTTGGKKAHPSEEARLMGELDLASRTDAASYKPNPWTIAKANAAVRAPQLPAVTKDARRRTSKKRSNTQTTVLDLLRMQPKVNTIVNAHQVQSSLKDSAGPVQEATSRTSLSPDHLLQDDAHISSDDTLVDSVSDLGVSTKLSGHSSTLASSLSGLSPGRTTPRQAAILVPQVLRSHPTSSPRSSSPINLSAGAPPPSFNTFSAGQELRAFLFHSALSSGPPSKGPSISQPAPAFAPFSKAALESSFPGKWHLLPQLLQLVSLLLSPEFVVAPSVGQRSSSTIRSRSPPPLFSGELGDFPRQPSYHPTSGSPPISARAYSPPTWDLAPHPASSPLRNNGEPQQLQGQRAMLNRFAFQSNSPLPPALVEPLTTIQPSSSPSLHHSKVPSRLSSNTGLQASRLSTIGIAQGAPPRKVPRHDAYKAFSSPDSSWSTIALEKNRKQQGSYRTKPVTTTNFKLRLQPARPTSESRKGRGDAASETADTKPRIVTYLPPPPRRLAREPEIDIGREPRLCLDNYSGSTTSPHNQDPQSPTVFHPMSIHRAVAPHMSLSAYRAPTPAPSSGRRVSECPSPHREPAHDVTSDATLTFDQSGLPQRYAAARRGIAKVGGFVDRTVFYSHVAPWYVLPHQGHH